MKLNINAIISSDYNECFDFGKVYLNKKEKQPVTSPKRIDESKEKSKKVDYSSQRRIKRGEQ